MKGIKAIYETLTQGPVRVRVMAVYSTYNGQPLEVICRVTGRSSKIWPAGSLLVTTPMFLWEKHRFVGKLKCRSLWEGRPDLSGLPKADEQLLHALSKGVTWAYVPSSNY